MTGRSALEFEGLHRTLDAVPVLVGRLPHDAAVVLFAHIPSHRRARDDDSLGAAILNNAEAADDVRISSVLCEQAREIAHAGLRYFNAVMDHSRSLIDRF